ncbi:hypothetical protein ABPG74_014010 [Tetrahymena malaccensis]
MDTQINIKKLNIPSINFREGGSIPLIGFGTYLMRGQECKKAVEHAILSGYTQIDTAAMYGNEQDIAEVIHSKKLNLQREDLFITSKVNYNEQGYENAKKSVSQMLKRLKVNYLDCVLIHWPGVSHLDDDDPKNATVRTETWKALIELKKQGIIKHIGVSNFNINHLDHLIANSEYVPEMNQFEIHPLCHDLKLVKYCQDKGIIVQAYCPLARNHKKVITNKLILELANKYKKTVAQILLRWGFQNNYVIIPKSKTPKYIEENVQILDFQFTQEEMNKLNQLNCNLHVDWDPICIKY